MKKFISIILCIALVSTMLVVGASAAYMDDANHFTADSANNSDTAGKVATGGQNGDEIGTAEIPVYIQTTTDSEVVNVYAISYDVTELVFEYSKDSTRIWNPETLMYETTSDGGSWNTTSQDITVTNYSDIPVKVTPSQEAANPAVDGVTITLGSALELDSAFDGDYNTAGSEKSGTISVTVSGEPTEDYTSKTLMATVTLIVTDNR